MSFEWQSLLEVARLLEKEANHGSIDAEALRRSAVGRAYYAAFCHARNYAVQYLGYQIKGFGDDHGSLRAHLKKRRREATPRGWIRFATCETMPIMQMN